MFVIFVSALLVLNHFWLYCIRKPSTIPVFQKLLEASSYYKSYFYTNHIYPLKYFLSIYDLNMLYTEIYNLNILYTEIYNLYILYTEIYFTKLKTLTVEKVIPCCALI